MTDLPAEDAKLVTLARATRARARSIEGAAVRDRDGRTYAAASIDLPSLQLAALQACVAMAVSSGATGLEAAVLLSDAVGDDPAGLDAVRDVAGPGVAVHLGDARGTVTTTLFT
jgi:hypothetical protein